MKIWIAAGAASLAGLVAVPLAITSLMFGPPPLPALSIATQEVSSCTVQIPASARTAGALSAEQVAKYAYAAGFRGQDINIAVAVARAESGWRPTATLLNTNGSTDHGLFQINSIHAAILAEGNWADPADNAKMAFKVWTQAGGKWSPWVTYWRGTYKQYLTDVDPKPTCTTPKSTGPCKKVSGEFSNGLIPASALCTLWTNRHHRLRADAANSFDAMSRAYMAKFGVRLCLTDSYRPLSVQIDLKRRKGFLAAKPGTSNHGWGLAVDLCARGSQENPQPWNRGTEDDVWLHQNAPKFGWVHPGWAEPSGSKPEPWHWGYNLDKEHAP